MKKSNGGMNPPASRITSATQRSVDFCGFVTHSP
jgi:hypothetical protein